ncbi:polyubiquitin-like [Megalops cyprinoides]|uniref:polyubiquitin-like n=1 Tax=Megalops cyprinoides TaxID=118141 RepID=UPI0018654FB6|nr:polyubiquitin-like [Megalops cyprinoides]XP_036385452.1 polyubiquitin-like [Megalops cyprinoides]
MDQLTIKFLSGQTFSLSVSMDTTVGSLKDLIQQRTDVPTARQRLTAQNGQRVDLKDDSKTLRQYGVSAGCVVLVLVTEPSQPTFIQVFLRTDKGLTHAYTISPAETVSQFKRKVAERENIPVDQQRLIYEGKQMDDGKKLADYGVRAESTIFLSLRLRGGNPDCFATFC